VSARFALLVSGASGMRLPLHLLRLLAPHPGVERLHLVVSAGASQVLRHELDLARPGTVGLLQAAELPAAAREKVLTHRDGELDAAIASGSYRLGGTVILPCSAATVGALATGSGTTLIHRAGAVALKEGWPLLVGFRETPLSVVHLESLRRLAYAGATIVPPIPAFYIGEETMERFLDAYALRLLDRLGLPMPHAEDLRWHG
jgi:flavin prenyltransferase